MCGEFVSGTGLLNTKRENRKASVTRATGQQIDSIHFLLAILILGFSQQDKKLKEKNKKKEYPEVTRKDR